MNGRRRLADFLMANCPLEIEEESAGDTAIRLLTRMVDAIERVLLELNVPGPDGCPPVGYAQKELRAALGQWGKE